MTINAAELGQIVIASHGLGALVKFVNLKNNYGETITPPDKYATVTAYSNYGANQHYFTLTLSTGAQTAYYLSKDSEIEIIDPESDEGKDLRAKIDADVAINLQRYLGHSCNSAIDIEMFAVKPSGNVFPCWQQYKETNDRPAFAHFLAEPSHCLAYTLDNAQMAMKHAYLHAKSAKEGSKLTISPVMELGKKTLREANEKNLLVHEPDVKNAYGLRYSLPPAREMVIRGASAKPRWLTTMLTDKNIVSVIKTMDAIIGVACVSLLHELDEPALRTIHALPGEYRKIDGGFEYGALSNTWLCHPFITNLVFDLSRKAMALALGGRSHLWKASDDEVVDIMLTCDAEKARAVLERNKDVLYKMFQAAWAFGPGASADKVYEIFTKGVSVAVKDPKDLVTNWCLNTSWMTHCEGTNKNVKHAVAALIKDTTLRIA